MYTTSIYMNRESMICHRGITIKFLVFVVWVCVFVAGDDAVKVRCIAREREALLSFKDGLIDEDGYLSSWRGEECCKWSGVECSNTTGHVIKLQPNTYHFYYILEGQVGSSLLELHHLRYLDLSGIYFGGKPIPKFIGSMKQLQHLFLNSSGFSGIVPPQIGNLTNLLSLDLSCNSFESDNLDWLSSLSLLSFLDLSRFNLSDTNWQQNVLSLPSLHELNLGFCNIGDGKPFHNSSSTSLLSIVDLSYNFLTWSSFDWLSNISKSLVKIDMSTNSLEGPIPNALIERLIYIEHLDLSSNKLESQIPKSFGNLSRLRVLHLHHNDLRGNLDEFFGNVSAKGLMESLEILNLADNHLNGSVPDLIGEFSALTGLYLAGNNFRGSMPLSIGQLSNLHVLDLSKNSLEGPVSESHFIKLDKLKVLDLSSNLLMLNTTPDWSPPFQLDWIFLASCYVGPSFPKWIQSQRNLLGLDLSRNGITGELPKWLWTFSPLLEVLYLSHNQISGTIPNLSSTSITSIYLSNNSISGPIPLFNARARDVQLNGNMFTGSISSICEIQHDKLWYLDLSNNQLRGEVPNCWEKMTMLLSLNLDNNSFSGEIPPSLGTIYELRALQLHGNNLSGELPSTLRLRQGLQVIDVGGNKLRGEIPTWIGELYRMRVLNLRGNKLYGRIPTQICNLTEIQVLDLSINSLFGEIPDCFNNFTVLAHNNTFLEQSDFTGGFLFQYSEIAPLKDFDSYSSYSSFQWKGQELEYTKNLQLLKLIDFSSNKLIGNIPHSLSNMTRLNSLNLSRNSLTGNIIPDIGEMEMLECLDLSHNHLSGKIPTSLAQLHSLAVLDLSNNSFSGKIPISTQLQSFNASVYAGNDGLCGAPLALCPEDNLTPSTTNPEEKKNERDGGFSFMQEVGISMGFGFIFGFWGVVGSFILKKSWRIAFFNFFDDVGDWYFYPK